MKYIFLDIDGVLRPFKAGTPGRELRKTNTTAVFSSRALDLLAQLVKESGAAIVLSSNWRNVQTAEDAAALKRFTDVLAGRSLHIFSQLEIPPASGGRAAGAAPQRSGSDDREQRIRQWLRQNDPHPEAVCILDDRPMDGPLAPYSVLCSCETGLTEEDLLRAKQLLNGAAEIPRQG